MMRYFRGRKGLMGFVLWAYVHTLFATAFASQSPEYQAFLRDNPKELIQEQTGKAYRPVVAYGLKKFIDYQKSPTEEGEEALLNLLTYGDGVGGMCQDPNLFLNPEEEALYRAIYAQILLNRNQRGLETHLEPREGEDKKSNIALFQSVEASFRGVSFFNDPKKGFLEAEESLGEKFKGRGATLALTESETESNTKPSTNEIIGEDSAEENLSDQEESGLEVSHTKETEREEPSFWRQAQATIEAAQEQQRLYQLLKNPPLPENGRSFGKKVLRQPHIISVNRQPRSFAFPSLGLSLQSLVLKLNTGFKTEDLTVYELPQADVVFDFLGHYHGLGLLKVKSFTMKAAAMDIGHPYHAPTMPLHWHEKNGGGIESESFIRILTQGPLNCYFGSLKCQQGLLELISPESVTLWASTISNPNGTGISVRSPKVAIEMSKPIFETRHWSGKNWSRTLSQYYPVSESSLLETNGFVSFQPYDTALKVTNHGGTIKGLQGIFKGRRPLMNEQNQMILIHEPGYPHYNPSHFLFANFAQIWSGYQMIPEKRALFISDVPPEIITGNFIAHGADILGKFGMVIEALKISLTDTNLLSWAGDINVESKNDMDLNGLTAIAKKNNNIHSGGKLRNVVDIHTHHYQNGNKEGYTQTLGKTTRIEGGENVNFTSNDYFYAEVPTIIAGNEAKIGSQEGNTDLVNKKTENYEKEETVDEGFFTTTTQTKEKRDQQIHKGGIKAKKIISSGNKFNCQNDCEAEEWENNSKHLNFYGDKTAHSRRENIESDAPFQSVRQGYKAYQEIVHDVVFNVKELVNTCNDAIVEFQSVIKHKEFKSNLPIKESTIRAISYFETWHEVDRVFPEGTEIAVALAASLWTYGATAGLVAGTTGVVLQAGAASMASIVAREFVVHGDPFRAVETLGKTENLKQIGVAMASAGLMDKLIGPLPTDINPAASPSQLYSSFFKHELMKKCITTPLDVLILNKDLKDALVDSVKHAIVNAGANTLCYKIGQIYGAKKRDDAVTALDYALHKGSHAVVGFVSSAALGGNRNKHFGAGLGAMMAEIAGDALIDQEDKREAAEIIAQEVKDQKIPEKDQKAYFYKRGKEIFAKEFIMAKVIGTTAGALFFKEDGARGAEVAADRAIEHNFAMDTIADITEIGMFALGVSLLAKKCIEKRIESYNKARQGENGENEQAIPQPKAITGSGGMDPNEPDHDPEDYGKDHKNDKWDKNKDGRWHHEEAKDKSLVPNRPNFQNEELKKMAEQVYRKGDRYPGGSAEMLRKEIVKGVKINDTHIIKCEQRLTQIKKVLSNPKNTISRLDRQAAEAMMKDLRDAINLAKGGKN